MICWVVIVIPTLRLTLRKRRMRKKKEEVMMTMMSTSSCVRKGFKKLLSTILPNETYAILNVPCTLRSVLMRMGGGATEW